MKNIWKPIAGLSVLAFVAMTAYNRGIDANVYLHAATQLLAGGNIYANNPYNDYLYSPVFALLLSPLTYLGFDLARVAWALLQAFLVWRLFVILRDCMRQQEGFRPKDIKVWAFVIVLLSVGFFTLNLNLGQITILILWFTGEGLYQILIQKKALLGAVWLGLGVVIKILPILGVIYLLSQWKIKESVLVGFVILAGLVIPSVFVGHSYNVELHQAWFQKINPSGEKYILENHEGSFTHSLNAMIPAFLHDFEDPVEADFKYRRRIADLSQETVVGIVQVARLLLFLSLFWMFWHPRKLTMDHKMFFYWCLGAVCLVTVQIFPHQQKYAQLYCVPAAGYLFAYWWRLRGTERSTRWTFRLSYGLALIFMLVVAVNGRDIIGNTAVEWLDYYHIQGWINLYWTGLLWISPPRHAGSPPLSR